MSKPLVQQPNDYHKLIVYQKANLVYLLNNWFIKNSSIQFRRTMEQMEQAARSGKQNIVEGLNNYATSKPSGIHLVNVAKGSLLELQADYEDYLQTNSLQKWHFTDPRFEKAQELGKEKNEDQDYFIKIFSTRPAETSANIMLVLIGQAVYLLTQFLKTLERDVKENGGFRENISKYRRELRKNNGH